MRGREVSRYGKSCSQDFSFCRKGVGSSKTSGNLVIQRKGKGFLGQDIIAKDSICLFGYVSLHFPSCLFSLSIGNLLLASRYHFGDSVDNGLDIGDLDKLPTR